MENTHIGRENNWKVNEVVLIRDDRGLDYDGNRGGDGGRSSIHTQDE